MSTTPWREARDRAEDLGRAAPTRVLAVPVTRAAGMARNPRTGQSVARPASKTARFRVGEGLKGSLNG